MSQHRAAAWRPVGTEGGVQLTQRTPAQFGDAVGPGELGSSVGAHADGGQVGQTEFDIRGVGHASMPPSQMSG